MWSSCVSLATSTGHAGWCCFGVPFLVLISALSDAHFDLAFVIPSGFPVSGAGSLTGQRLPGQLGRPGMLEWPTRSGTEKSLGQSDLPARCPRPPPGRGSWEREAGQPWRRGGLRNQLLPWSWNIRHACGSGLWRGAMPRRLHRCVHPGLPWSGLVAPVSSPGGLRGARYKIATRARVCVARRVRCSPSTSGR